MQIQPRLVGDAESADWCEGLGFSSGSSPQCWKGGSGSLRSFSYGFLLERCTGKTGPEQYAIKQVAVPKVELDKGRYGKCFGE